MFYWSTSSILSGLFAFSGLTSSTIFWNYSSSLLEYTILTWRAIFLRIRGEALLSSIYWLIEESAFEIAGASTSLLSLLLLRLFFDFTFCWNIFAIPCFSFITKMFIYAYMLKSSCIFYAFAVALCACFCRTLYWNDSVSTDITSSCT